MPTTFESGLFGHLWTDPTVRDCFEDRAQVQGWLRAEAALAQAQGELGIIPSEAAAEIASKCDVDLFDFDAMREGILATGHPIVPMIRQLVELCGEHGAWVHWGTTTQDIMDTGLILQIRDALATIKSQLDSAVTSAVELAQRHATTTMAGRTHAQHAIPIPFGHKLAVWADELLRARDRLHTIEKQSLAGSLAGAAGTFATLGTDGSAVRKRYCELLGLVDTVVPWHTNRDRLRDLLFALDHIATAGERIGAEIVRMQSTELGEAAEPAAPQHIGSSTMPQKRNPFTSELMYVDAKLVHSLVSGLMSNSIHAYERDMMSWAQEWFAVPSIVMLTSGVTSKLALVLEGLYVSPERMREVLAMSQPEIMSEPIMMSLAHHLGHEVAHNLVHAAAKNGTPERPMLDILRDDLQAHGVDEQVLDVAASPENYRGLTDEYIANVRDRHAASVAEGTPS
ncbi:class-II fumarase/aspartase family protein [Ruicaihuangia caeni]|uniref:Adenylosuccinate lyase family protein n=1 Tax=Ruicaihuangia caeni TaxID=3042517 RepID=A0AAW6TBU1_9MICO|nr:adenylosuccinate lyase family protein [Klugiella sp. YN-L-19]MDI2099087.1 adenylosuccinate lyase family protein [Klugiella sp. YN-L-19]